MWCHFNVVSYGCGVVCMSCSPRQPLLSLVFLPPPPPPRPLSAPLPHLARTMRSIVHCASRTIPPLSYSSCLARVVCAIARVVCAIGLGVWFLVYVHLYVDVFLLVVRARTMPPILRALHAYIHAYIYMSYIYTCIHTYMYYIYYIYTTHIYVYWYAGCKMYCRVVAWRTSTSRPLQDRASVLLLHPLAHFMLLAFGLRLELRITLASLISLSLLPLCS